MGKKYTDDEGCFCTNEMSSLYIYTYRLLRPIAFSNYSNRQKVIMILIGYL